MGIWIAVVIFIGGFAMAGAMAIMASNEEPAKVSEPYALTDEEREAAQEILEKYQWKTVYSDDYSVRCCDNEVYDNPDIAEMAAELSMEHAWVFAAKTGYDKKLIKKLYYHYNKANGNVGRQRDVYGEAHVPTQWYWGEVQRKGYDYTYRKNIIYNIEYFVLDYKQPIEQK